MPVGASPATCVHGDQAVIAPLLEAASGCMVRLAAVAAPANPAAPFEEWVAQPTASVLEHLRRIALDPAAAPDVTPLVIVWVFPTARGVAESVAQVAAIESLRGIVQSVTREKARAWAAPVNGIAAQLDDLDSAISALRFLGAPDGGFTAGSTFDLTTGSEGTR